MRRLSVLIGIPVLLLTLVVALRLAASRQASVATPLPVFRLGVNTWVGYAPFYLADVLGYFRDEGIDMEILPIEDVAQKKAALRSGRLDGLADTLDALILNNVQGVPSVAVAQLDTSNGADGIVVTDDIGSIADLKGRTIAVQRNFVSETFLDYLLLQSGLSPDDVRKVDTEGGAAGAAFVAGKVDAAVTFEPWLTKASERENGKILTSSKDHPDVLVDVLLVRPESLTTDSETVAAVLRGWFRAVDYAHKYPDDAYRIMASQYKVTPAEFAEFLTGLSWPSREDNLRYFTSGAAVRVADMFGELFLRTGQIDSKPAVAPLLDAAILQSLDAR